MWYTTREARMDSLVTFFNSPLYMNVLVLYTLIHDLRNSMNERNTLLYKIYISQFILEKGPQFVVSLRDRLRVIYSERRFLLVPCLLPRARGCQLLHPRESRIVRDDLTLWSAACPSLDSRFSALCLNLTAWLSRGLLPVTHLLDLIALMCCPVY